MPPAPQHPASPEPPPPRLASGSLTLAARWWLGSLFFLPARQPDVAQFVVLPQLWPLAFAACLLARPP
eukprot:14802290-Alexandrium_andersonii.AAC.1